MRREELKHAQDIREMYEDKLRRASKIYSKLEQCLDDLAVRERVCCIFLHLFDFTQTIIIMISIIS